MPVFHPVCRGGDDEIVIHINPVRVIELLDLRIGRGGDDGEGGDLRVSQHREQVVLEYAFWYAAIDEPRLQLAVRKVARRWIGLVQPWLSLLPVTQPEQAARSMLATLRRIEYEGLIASGATESPTWISDALAYQLKGLW